MGKKILIVDDDGHIRETVEYALTESGFDCLEAENGKVALEIFRKASPDLIILDINMPELDGIEVCKEIRKVSDTPIIFLSSRDQELDKIIGLELGGDDYVAKPFSPRELVARVKRILHRAINSAPKVPNKCIFKYKDLTLNIEKRVIYWQEREVLFSATEFDILASLIKRPEIVFTREMLIDSAYEDNFHLSDRTIDSHIRRMRAKLKNVGAVELIHTVRGIGYKIH